ncbi:hypothetical protein L6452_36987 [Arctium lappa]|uniref:Uncharacterized protein n=1 Tax=Arctium lappa TaxID=4217 RepID=A0ACB8Y1Q2_ARCLA|nr:hypothetical protein L6452_36987 [Arctium lappa]
MILYPTYLCTNNKLDHRSEQERISVVTILGKGKNNELTVMMEIFRDDGSCKTMYLSKLETLSFYECLEFKETMKKSRSIHRGHVEKMLEAFISKVTTRLSVPSNLPQRRRIVRRKHASSSENDVVIRNETIIKLSREVVVGLSADLSAIDLSVPHGKALRPGKVINKPLGIFFRDDEENIWFQMASEVPICPLGHLKDLLYVCAIIQHQGPHQNTYSKRNT